MTAETARWLLSLLDTLTLSAGAADFDEAVKHIQATRRELSALLTGQLDDVD